ncbi:hypothetical protein IMG5_183890, partial [Ichthyophthirius multifiliis]
LIVPIFKQFDLSKRVWDSSVCHIFSLFWYGLAYYEINVLKRTDTWIHAQNLLDSPVSTRYIYSFYYLATTMITVGYGDVTPKNQIECIFSVITMFFTGCVYAYSLNSIGNIIQNIEKSNISYREDMQVIHRLMREENVDNDLRIRISDYIEYIHKESNEVLKKLKNEVIDKLSKHLKSDLVQEIQAQIMEECLFSPGEVIFHQSDYDDNCLYILVKGNVEIIQESLNQKQYETIIKVLKKNQYFGEIGFITGNKRCATAKAIDFCRAYRIRRTDFLEIIRNNSYDYENFQMVIEAFDCGLHMGKQGYEQLPLFDKVKTDKIDIIFITHFHLDHCAALPYITSKTNFKGKVYATSPTRAIYKHVLKDSTRDKSDNITLYKVDDIERSLKFIEVIDFHQEMEHDNIKFKCYPAGHVLGAAMFLVEIEGVRVLYTGDYSTEKDILIQPAEIPHEKQMYQQLKVHTDVVIMNQEVKEKVVKNGGKCLLPVLALGRAQEIVLILEQFWKQNATELQDIKIHYTAELFQKANKIFQYYKNMMSDPIFCPRNGEREKFYFNVTQSCKIVGDLEKENKQLFSKQTLCRGTIELDENQKEYVKVQTDLGIWIDNQKQEATIKWTSSEKNDIIADVFGDFLSKITNKSEDIFSEERKQELGTIDLEGKEIIVSQQNIHIKNKLQPVLDLMMNIEY